MGNKNTGVFQPEKQAVFFPGRELAAEHTARIATNHNFLITHSGHTLVSQVGNGEQIATDGTWRPFAYYVIVLNHRGGDLRMRLLDTTGTAGYEFRFAITGTAGTVTSGAANAGNGFETTIGWPGDTYHEDNLLVTCEIRRTSGSGNVTIGQLIIGHDVVTTDPFTTQTRLYGLAEEQWDTAGAAIDVQGVRHASGTAENLYELGRKHLVTLCAWNNYGLTPAPTVSLGTSGKSAADVRERIVGGLHTGAPGRRTYRIFATGRNSAAVTATYTMAVEGYGDANFAFTISNNGNTVFGRGNWPAWDLSYRWSSRRDFTAWDLIAAISATNFTYLQALTIIEDAEPT